jgi:hypothetical protein
MNKLLLFLSFLLSGILWFYLQGTAISAPAGLGAGPPAQLPPNSISGPYQSGNMAVYLIHGKDKVKSANIMTLQEALDRKQVTVYETGDVNQLAVENKSDCVVFIQSGDIVKGGRQDRTMQYDMLLQPRSGRVPLPAFCVEHGRWTGRAEEADGTFGSSHYSVSGKAMKAAINGAVNAMPQPMRSDPMAGRGSQESVWASVSVQQSRLASGAGGSVASKESPSSMQLTLEHPRVKEATNQHLQKLSKLIDDQPDAIGYAVAINGKINSADVYVSHDLFKKLWPKLLNSSATEAVADVDKDKSATPAPKPAKVQDFLDNADRAKAKSKIASKTSGMTEQESSDGYSYKTQWFAAPRSQQVLDERPVIHSNYLSK